MAYDDEFPGEERRDEHRREADRFMEKRVERLEQTIYGLRDEEGSGLVRRFVQLGKEIHVELGDTRDELRSMKRAAQGAVLSVLVGLATLLATQPWH